MACKINLRFAPSGGASACCQSRRRNMNAGKRCYAETETGVLVHMRRYSSSSPVGASQLRLSRCEAQDKQYIEMIDRLMDRAHRIALSKLVLRPCAGSQIMIPTPGADSQSSTFLEVKPKACRFDRLG